jgi:hypothetical protein
MGSKPLCFSSTVLVHSQTPPRSDCPQSFPPLSATATGCQRLKPAFAPSRLMKRSYGFRLETVPEPPLDKVWDGGDSSTPLLIRWLSKSAGFDACSLELITHSLRGSYCRATWQSLDHSKSPRNYRCCAFPPWLGCDHPSTAHSRRVRRTKP